MSFGKLKFPISINMTTTLSDLVETDSWFILDLLQLVYQFLTEDVDKLSDLLSYKTSLQNIGALNVVNDSAERGVKLISDFVESAKKEEHYQNVLQVVEQNRKQHSNMQYIKCL